MFLVRLRGALATVGLLVTGAGCGEELTASPFPPASFTGGTAGSSRATGGVSSLPPGAGGALATGGVPSGGVPSGGAPSGGAATGGTLATSTGGAPPGGSASSGGGATAEPLREVLLVGNSVSGSVSVIDTKTLESLGSIDVTPDRDEVLGLINADLVRSIAYPIVKNQQLLHHFEPDSGNRFVDDLFVSPDGTVLYVSRSNLGDVAAFDLTRAGQPRLWRTFVNGLKADHATLSPDGSRLVVSATTARVANVLDTKSGAIVGSFPTGYYPHQNDYSPDGRYIYNSSIGNVGYNAVSHANNMQKGDRWLVKVDATTLKVERTYVFDFGIRPSVFNTGETILYAQLSYLNGVIKYDMVAGKEIARNEQPLSEFALATYATYDEYPHDSAHHGLAISGDGARLCDCGTIDNTVAIVRTADMQTERMVQVGNVPYWASTSYDGKLCFVSISGDDLVTVVSYETGAIVESVPVGRFPQRNRLARLRERDLARLHPMPG
jgi:YVTN family beta-propeller protein